MKTQEHKNTRRSNLRAHGDWISQYFSLFLFFYIFIFLFTALPVSASDLPKIIAVPDGQCPIDRNVDQPKDPNASPIRMECKFGLCIPQATKNSVTTLPQAQQASNLPCNFTLDNILQTGVNMVKLIIAIAGSLMLLFILYGGFQMVTSLGNAEGIQAGKKTLTAAFIGLIIIFGATVLVRFAAGLILPNVGTLRSGTGAVIPPDTSNAMPKITVPQ